MARTHISEIHVIADTGCQVSSRCLECPLSHCKYDDPVGFVRWMRNTRYKQIVVAMNEAGYSVSKEAAYEAVSQRLRVSRRTIDRAMRFEGRRELTAA